MLVNEWGTINVTSAQVLTKITLSLNLSVLKNVVSSHSYGDKSYCLTATTSTATAWSNASSDTVKFLISGF